MSKNDQNYNKIEVKIEQDISNMLHKAIYDLYLVVQLNANENYVYAYSIKSNGK